MRKKYLTMIMKIDSCFPLAFMLRCESLQINFYYRIKQGLRFFLVFIFEHKYPVVPTIFFHTHTVTTHVWAEVLSSVTLFHVFIVRLIKHYSFQQLHNKSVIRRHKSSNSVFVFLNVKIDSFGSFVFLYPYQNEHINFVFKVLLGFWLWMY